MKTAGLSLDFYDDISGETLKSSFPTPDSLPGIIKKAHILSPEERDVLRDEAYALVMQDEGKVFRKFACVDPGNTALSTLYFLHNMDKLPAEAIKVAAANLADHCEAFGLPVPPLLKVAVKTGMSRTRDSFRQPQVGDEADWAARTNLQSIRGGADSGRVIPTANGMKTAAANLVDVSGKTPEFKFKRKEAQNTALDGKYPLDDYADVEKAVDYFNENWTGMDPADRHQYAVKTASRADQLGIEVPEILGRYGSTEYSPDVDAHLANRRAIAPAFEDVWDDLAEKRASIHPEVFAFLLKEADEAAGINWNWGGEVADPWFATFGGDSEREKVASWSWEGAGGESLNQEQLMALASDPSELKAHFDASITTAFCQDPVTIFESLPDTHKQLIANLAGA